MSTPDEMLREQKKTVGLNTGDGGRDPSTGTRKEPVDSQPTLAEAKHIDEIKDWRDKSLAIQAYARQAKNRQLEIDASEIRIRAERRLGEMLRDQGLNPGVRMKGKDKIGGAIVEPPKSIPTLAQIGIDKKLSARAQQLAAVPAEEFNSRLGEWRDRVAVENEPRNFTVAARAKR